MVINVNKPDYLMTCPLDESHRILKSRMQFHLVRCSKNHKMDDKMKCPWNPLHIIDKFAYEDHWQNKCEDLPKVMGSVINIQATDESNIAVVPSSVTNVHLPSTEEDWDSDLPCGTYDPLKNSEGKAVLRSAIGLSKAKKKEWHRQERLRYQRLDDVLPIQINSTTKEKIIGENSCRPPHTPAIAMSADTSMSEDLNCTTFNISGITPEQFLTNLRRPHTPCIGLSSPGMAMSANSSVTEELKSTRISTGHVDVAELSKSLRPPHAPSAGLSYIADDTISICSRDQTISLADEAFGFDNEQIHAGSSDWFANEMQEFKHQQGDSDAKSCVSSTSTSSRTSSLYKFLGLASGTEERAKLEMPKVQLQNEAACLPVNEPTSVERSTGVDDEAVDRLSELLADLESKEKQIKKERAAILARFQQLAPKTINPKANEANGKNPIDSAASKDPSLSVKTGNDIVNEIPKCAANFRKFKKPENIPTAGVGQDVNSFENQRSDPSSEEKNPN